MLDNKHLCKQYAIEVSRRKANSNKETNKKTLRLLSIVCDRTKSGRPGLTLGEGEILEPDESVYIMRHSTGVDWPCLSFDILRDSLGEERQRFPHTAWIVTGTQADIAKNNEIIVYKMSSLQRTQRENGEHSADHFCAALDNTATKTRTMKRTATTIRWTKIPCSSTVPSPTLAA